MDYGIHGIDGIHGNRRKTTRSSTSTTQHGWSELCAPWRGVPGVIRLCRPVGGARGRLPPCPRRLRFSHADLQNDPADIRGSSRSRRIRRRLRRPHPAAGRRLCGRRRASRTTFANRVTRESVTDVGCTLRADHADCLQRIPVFNGHGSLPAHPAAWPRLAEMPVNHRPRLYGQPKYKTPATAAGAGGHVLGVRWVQEPPDRSHAVRGDRRLDIEPMDPCRIPRPEPLLRPFLSLPSAAKPA